MSKRKPMATYNKTSPQYQEIRQTRYKQYISKTKELLILLFLLVVTCVDLESLFDILL